MARIEVWREGVLLGILDDETGTIEYTEEWKRRKAASSPAKELQDERTRKD